MSLASGTGVPPRSDSAETILEDSTSPLDVDSSINTSHFARTYTDQAIEKLRQQVAAFLDQDVEDQDIDQELLHRDKSSCMYSIYFVVITITHAIVHCPHFFLI
jgi:hypothetical protein